MEFGTVRFNELKRYLRNVSDRTLSSNLKHLEARAFRSFPPGISRKKLLDRRDIFDTIKLHQI
jgi:hypothetical protein